MYDQITDMLLRKTQELEQMRAAAEAMRRIGSLETAIAEAEKKWLDIKDKISTAESQLAVAEDATKQELRNAKEVIKAADKQVADKLKAAEDEANAIIDKAKSDALSAAEAVKTAQKSVLTKLAKQIEAAQSELAGLEQTIANANNTIATRTAEADKVERRLDEIRKSIAALTGANLQ